MLAKAPHGTHTIGRKNPSNIKIPFHPCDVASRVARINTLPHVIRAQIAPRNAPVRVETNRGLHFGLEFIVVSMIKRDNGNVHRAAAKIIVSKSRAARGSVCNVLLSRRSPTCVNSD